MPVSVTSYVPAGHNLWEATAAGASYYYWRSSTGWEHEGPEATVLIPVPAGTSPTIEVQDTAFTSTPYPGTATIQGFVDEDADDYDHVRFEEYVDAAWTERERQDCDGRGWYLFTSRWLEDVTAHQFRVVPYSTAGNAGTVTNRTIFMVRVPDAPDLSVTYDSDTGLVTIDEA